MTDSVSAEDKLEPLDWFVPGVTLHSVLTGTQLLAKDEHREQAVHRKWDDDTPASVEAIRSGATQITRWWSKLAARISGAGGVTAVAGIAAGAIDDVRETLGDPVIVALVSGGAVVAAAALLAAAIVIRGDLEARGVATAARYTGRADVTAAFLSATVGLSSSARPEALAAELITALGCCGNGVSVECRSIPGLQRLTAVSRSVQDGFSVHLDGFGWKPIGDVRGYRTDLPTPASGLPGKP